MTTTTTTRPVEPARSAMVISPSTPMAARQKKVSKPISTFLYNHPVVHRVALLVLPVGWMALVYIVALLALLITALWSVNEYTGAVEMTWTFSNIVEAFTDQLYLAVTGRTLLIAVIATVADVLLAFPIAFFMARMSKGKARRILLILVSTPLWASYLVKAYAWRSVLSGSGLLDMLLAPLHMQSPGYGLPAVIVTEVYLWLPYAITPIFTAFEQVPESLLEASGDLGAHTWTTIRSVLLPMIVPGMVAGSIFSFSLSLGDYIVAGIVGGKTQVLGNLIYTDVGVANNAPMAAACALIPIIIIAGYLLLVSRTGALKRL
ncbi:ABC transporter permease [Bifidobacterium thermacidophilum]|uniref:ABC transporter permease n=1 Tax=Bifidobacterium thermacidophilum TaxID=246618 RepID=A0ABW8KQR3_9BIFI